jgi:hypothetical protein
LAGYKNGAQEDLEMHVNLEADIQGVSGSWRCPMVQLSGIKTQSAAGNRLFMKKLKLGPPKLG